MAASCGITGLGGICDLGCSVTFASRTVVVTVTLGGLGSVTSSVVGALSAFAILSAFTSALLPYSFSRAENGGKRAEKQLTMQQRHDKL